MNSNDDQNEHVALAFVLMPFEPEFNGVYHDLIVPALEEVGYEVRRADSVFDQQSILRDIINNIARADLIIAELSALNGNVMYELGIAHGLAKATVMLTQDITAVPFDLRSYRLITYSLNYNEVRKLRDQLKEVARRHREGSITFGNPVSDFGPRDLPELPQGVASTQATAIVVDEKSVAPPSTVGELGIFDFEENIERSQQDIESYMNRLTALANDFGADVVPYTKEMGALANTPGTSARKRELVRAIAGEITKFAEGLEAELPGLRDAWERFGESSNKVAEMARITNVNDRDNARGLIEGAKAFQDAIQGSTSNITETKGMLAQLRGVSKDLNRAIRQVEQAFDGVIEIFTIGIAYAARIRSVAEERLDESGQ